MRRQAPEYLVRQNTRVLSSDFVSHFPNRIVHIHHPFLPAYAGALPYEQAYGRGVIIIGATAHFVERIWTPPRVPEDTSSRIRLSAVFALSAVAVVAGALLFQFYFRIPREYARGGG